MEYFKNVSYVISHVFLLEFLYLFVPRRFSAKKTAAICLTSFAFLTLSDILKLNILPESGLCYVLTTLAQIFITQFTGIYIAEQRNSKILFLGLSASNYVIAGSLFAAIIHIYTGNDAFALFVSFLIHVVILLFLHLRVRETYLKWYGKEYIQNWWELCLIPVFFYCSFSFIAFFPHSLYENPDNIPGSVFFVITMFVSYVVVLRYVQSESNRAGIYWKNVLFQSYIKGLENHWHLVEQSEQNLKILRHDMRHYSSMIDSLLAQKEYDEIRKITAHINEVTDENKVVKHCDNLVINSILSEVTEHAQALAVDVRLDCRLPRELPVNNYEFAAVVANLFENAFICVKDFEPEKRYIDAKIHCAEDHLLLHMQNRYEQEIYFDSLSGLPKSRKGKSHGLGMQSISAFSDKISGNVVCFCEEEIFHIMLFAKFQV